MEFQKIYFLVPRPPELCDINISFAKNQHFWQKNSTFTQSKSMRAVLEVF